MFFTLLLLIASSNACEACQAFFRSRDLLKFAVEEPENNKLNWDEITKIAGQVNQIGKILGFDTDDDECLENLGIGAVIDRMNAEIRKTMQRWEQEKKQQIIEEEQWREEARQSVQANWAKKSKSLDFDTDKDDHLTNRVMTKGDCIQLQKSLQHKAKLARKRQIIEEEQWREEARQSVRDSWAKKLNNLDFDTDKDEHLSNRIMTKGDCRRLQERLQQEEKLARKRAIMKEAKEEEEALMRKLYKEGKLSFK